MTEQPETAQIVKSRLGTRKLGSIGTCERYRDEAGRLWKRTRKGWRVMRQRKSKND